jgi:hypothetical protein
MFSQGARDQEARIMVTQEAQKQNSTTSRLSDIQVQAVLREYGLSRTNANHLEENIWNTAAVLVTGSIAGLALLGGTIPDSPKPYDYILRAAIGALSIILVYWWKKIASVWYFIQSVLYYRIVEIEEQLDLYSGSYISYVDRASRGEEYPERPGVAAMVAVMKAHHKPLSVPRTVGSIGWVLIVVWLVFLATQVAAMLGWL